MGTMRARVIYHCSCTGEDLDLVQDAQAGLCARYCQFCGKPIQAPIRAIYELLLEGSREEDAKAKSPAYYP